MRILVISYDFSGSSLCTRLAREGNEVQILLLDPEPDDSLQGIIDRALSLETGLDWVGRDGLVVMDYVGMGSLQEHLRANGYAVVGGSAGGDRLEEDRPYCQRVLADCGIPTLPTTHFSDASDAVAHVHAHPGHWVIKQNGHPESTVCYVGQLEDGADVVDMLQCYERRFGKQGGFVLQQRAHGIEIGIGRYFNGSRWVGPIEFNVEHKRLCAGDLGPNTGEMGTLMWYDTDETNRLFQTTLAKLEPYLRHVNYRGDIDLNCIVNEQGAYPLEITARFGYPAVQTQMEIHASPWSEFLRAVAVGDDYTLDWRHGYALSVLLATPPFPYHGPGRHTDLSQRGTKIHFRYPVNDEDWNHIHPEEVMRHPASDGGHDYYVAGDLGYVMHVTGFGATVEATRAITYSRCSNIVIPRMFYRTDLGVQFAEHDQTLLTKWGWL